MLLPATPFPPSALPSSPSRLLDSVLALGSGLTLPPDTKRSVLPFHQCTLWAMTRLLDMQRRLHWEANQDISKRGCAAKLLDQYYRFLVLLSMLPPRFSFHIPRKKRTP